MPSRYDTLRTSTFRLGSLSQGIWRRNYAMLEFPEAWKGLLRDLASEGSSRPREQHSIPIGSLNQALRALVPDVVSVLSYAAIGQSRPWLYSAEPVPTAALAPMVRAWVRASFPRASAANIDGVLRQMRPDELQWQTVSVNLAACGADANGTARPPSELFRLLPDVLAARLSDPALVCEHGTSAVSRFRRSPADRGAELVSWPPHWHTDRRGRRWPFSFTVSLTLQTVPQQPWWSVNAHVGVRRWVNRPVRLGPRDASVYLLTSVPWIEAARHSRSFQIAPISWNRQGYAPQQIDAAGGMLWGSHLAEIFDHLTFQRPLPNPADLCVDPGRFLEGDENTAAALVYGTSMWTSHAVGAGAMPRDRSTIVGWVAGVLAPELILADMPQRVHFRLAERPRRLGAGAVTGGSAPAAASEEDNSDDQDGQEERASAVSTVTRGTAEQQACRLALSRAVGGALTLEVFYETAAMRAALIDEVLSDLGLAPQEATRLDATTRRWISHELSLTLREGPVGGMGAPLDLDQGVRNPFDRLHAAVQRRRDAVVERLPRVSTQEGVASLVELLRKETFERNTDEDPKRALRIGFAASGRVAQFVTVPVDGEESERMRHRAGAAWRDLLRQLGFQWSAPRFVLRRAALPEPLQYVGVWLVKQRRDGPQRVPQQVPVAVRLTSQSTDVLATTVGLDSWLPYREVLRGMAGRGPFAAERRGEHVVRFVQRVVDDVSASGPALLLTHAQNLREAWPWLKNGEFQPDQMRFGNAPSVPVDNWPGIRHVRVRTHDQEETPEWFCRDGDRLGFSQGLWSVPGTERVFGSTAEKALTARNLSAYSSKVEPRHTRTGRSVVEAEVTAWNPQFVELTVAAVQPGDEFWWWAALAHELRFVASHHDQPLLLPLPLHLARQMEEYVLPLKER